MKIAPFLTTYPQHRVLQQPVIPRQIFIVYQSTTHGMKRKRSAISGRELFNQDGRKHILSCNSLKENVL